MQLTRTGHYSYTPDFTIFTQICDLAMGTKVDPALVTIFMVPLTTIMHMYIERHRSFQNIILRIMGDWGIKNNRRIIGTKCEKLK